MKVLDLFAGTRSISKAFEERGHEAFSVEMDEKHRDIDWYADILTVTAQDILDHFGRPDVVWASPPCTTYSIAARRHHRDEHGNPVTEYAVISDMLVEHVLSLIKELKPKYWFIENPKGKLANRPFMKVLPKHLVTYCQYGDARMKPTHIWTNHENPQFKACKFGAPCHIATSRKGKRNLGTQGMKNAMERSVIPHDLCIHVAEVCEW